MVRSRSVFLVLTGLFVVVDVCLRLFFRSVGVGNANTGISFGFLPGVDLWVIVVALLVFVVNIKNFGWGGILVVAGGVVNLMDRIVYGTVWDYIHFSIFGFWNNGADVMIFVGVIMVVWKLSGKMKI